MSENKDCIECMEAKESVNKRKSELSSLKRERGYIRNYYIRIFILIVLTSLFIGTVSTKKLNGPMLKLFVVTLILFFLPHYTIISYAFTLYDKIVFLINTPK